jgi:hypothetical protein
MLISNWSVAAVLMEAGVPGQSSFALITEDIERNVSVGEQSTIASAHNLFGIDESGVVHRKGTVEVSWAEFRRACDALLYRGDPARLVAYPYGVAGGPSPDGLFEAVQWLFENRHLGVQAAEEVAKFGAGTATVAGLVHWVKRTRRRQIANKWRKQGFGVEGLREYFSSCPQWDTERLQSQMGLTELEARLALTNAGYEEGQDGLWRVSTSPEAIERKRGLKKSEDEAWKEFEGEL